MGAINFSIYYSFLMRLARDLSSFYFKKVNKTFSVTNKHKGTGYDPVTTSDRAFEKFIRSKISKKFPKLEANILGVIRNDKFVILKKNLHLKL